MIHMNNEKIRLFMADFLSDKNIEERKVDKKLLHFIKKYGLFFFAGTIAILFLYSEIIFGGYDFSFTNLMYQLSPWNSLGVETKGPLLSDVIDTITTELYVTIRDGLSGGLWDPSTALGTQSNISSWLYPLNYLYILHHKVYLLFLYKLDFFQQRTKKGMDKILFLHFHFRRFTPVPCFTDNYLFRIFSNK